MGRELDVVKKLVELCRKGFDAAFVGEAVEVGREQLHGNYVAWDAVKIKEHEFPFDVKELWSLYLAPGVEAMARMLGGTVKMDFVSEEEAERLGKLLGTGNRVEYVTPDLVPIELLPGCVQAIIPSKVPLRFTLRYVAGDGEPGWYEVSFVAWVPEPVAAA